MPTCPKCSAVVTHLQATALKASMLGEHPLPSVAFSCPACGVILGVTVDPLAIITDTAAAVANLLRQR